MAWRCLIVDDNRGFADEAQSLLHGQGVAVVGIATSAVEAARSVQELAPDVVLVDIALGEESGFDVARTVADGASRDAPRVILISTHDEREFADLIEESPAVGFLAKTDLSAKAIQRVLADGGGDQTER